MEATVSATKTKATKDWKCQECGRLMTAAQAERAMSVGCPECNSGDIDLAEHSAEVCS